MVGFPDFRSHSKSRPFATQPLFDHLKSRLVSISDPHYSIQFLDLSFFPESSEDDDFFDAEDENSIIAEEDEEEEIGEVKRVSTSAPGILYLRKCTSFFGGISIYF